MAYKDPEKVIAKYLTSAKVALGVDDVLVGDNRLPVSGKTGIVVGAGPTGVGAGSTAQGYLANLLIYAPDTVSGTRTTKDGVDKAFVVAGKVDLLFRTVAAIDQDGTLIVNPVCTAPFKAKDPLSEIDVVSMSVDFNAVQGV